MNSSKLLIKTTVKSLILIIIFSSALYSQQDTTLSESNPSDDKRDTTFVMEKSPWSAVLQSALVPGLGQIYNESYYKAPVIWGGIALLVYGWIYNDDLYSDYRSLYLQTPQIERYRTLRNFYRDQRDLFTIYIGLVYLLNLVDAYVDAHLYDFNVEEDFFTGIPMLNLKFNF